MSHSLPRRILSLAKQEIRDADTGQIRCLILHFSYNDGSEMYEARSPDGSFPTARFQLHSELERWLRRRGLMPGGD